MDRERMLKYGMNPHQMPASIYMKTGSLPFRVLNGNPGYINLLDALNGWALVKELDAGLNMPAAASFKHVSPSGAAVGLPLSPEEAGMYFVDAALSPLAAAYVRARGTDRMSAFGDFVALSRPCDEETAMVLRHEVSDGVIAPGYSKESLSILKQKRNGSYAVIQMDPAYEPPETEERQVYGVTFSQRRNHVPLTMETLSNVVTERRSISKEEQRDLLLALITLKYTQSNSVCFAKNGQTIGVGAGQQSRIHCTRLAGQKADLWHLRQTERALNLPFLSTLSRPQRDNALDCYLSGDAPDMLRGDNWRNLFSTRPAPMPAGERTALLAGITGVSLGSDAFFPFDDNILRGVASGVTCIAQPGGSIRDKEIIDCCNRFHIFMAFTGVRLFHH